MLREELDDERIGAQDRARAVGAQLGPFARIPLAGQHRGDPPDVHLEMLTRVAIRCIWFPVDLL